MACPQGDLPGGWPGAGPGQVCGHWGSCHSRVPCGTHRKDSVAKHHSQEPFPSGCQCLGTQPTQRARPPAQPRAPGTPKPGTPRPCQPQPALCLLVPLKLLAPSALLNSLAAAKRQQGRSEAPNAITVPLLSSPPALRVSSQPHLSRRRRARREEGNQGLSRAETILLQP